MAGKNRFAEQFRRGEPKDFYLETASNDPGQGLYLSASADVKVFCFFSSEKKDLP
jgi:hypothetical protein